MHRVLVALLVCIGLASASCQTSVPVSASPAHSLSVGLSGSPRAEPTSSGLRSFGGGPSASNAAVGFDPSNTHWTRVGVVDGSGTLVGFNGGYALLTAGDDGTLNAVRFSTDGRTWQTTDLAAIVANCPGVGPPGNDTVVDAVAAAITTNGHELVVVGEERQHDAVACAGGGSSRPVAWFSSDGRTWRRSAPFGLAGERARATAVWPTRSGWQAAVAGGTAPIWESPDGLTWDRLANPSATFEGRQVGAAGVGLDGTIVVSTVANAALGDLSEPRLLTSPDGQGWRQVENAGDCLSGSGATQIVGPAAMGVGTWMVVEDLRVCASRDLTSWWSTTMNAAPTVLAQTRYGAIFAGDACFGAGVKCAPEPKVFLSTDGVTWSPVSKAPTPLVRTLADGPAGVLMIGQHPTDRGTATVWRLAP